MKFAYRSTSYFFYKIKLLAKLSMMIFANRSTFYFLWNKIKLLAKLSTVMFAWRSTFYFFME